MFINKEDKGMIYAKYKNAMDVPVPSNHFSKLFAERNVVAALMTISAASGLR